MLRFFPRPARKYAGGVVGIGQAILPGGAPCRFDLKDIFGNLCEGKPKTIYYRLIAPSSASNAWHFPPDPGHFVRCNPIVRTSLHAAAGDGPGRTLRTAGVLM